MKVVTKSLFLGPKSAIGPNGTLYILLTQLFTAIAKTRKAQSHETIQRLINVNQVYLAHFLSDLMAFCDRG